MVERTFQPEELNTYVKEIVDGYRQQWNEELQTTHDQWNKNVEDARQQGLNEGYQLGQEQAIKQNEKIENLGENKSNPEIDLDDYDGASIFEDEKPENTNKKLENTDTKPENTKQENSDYLSGNLPCRKPEIFRYGGDFSAYIQNWLNYARIMRIPPEYKVRTLLTYLDAECQDKIRTLNLSKTEKTKVKLCIPKLKQVLEPNKTVVESRIKLFRAEQEPEETLTDFAGRLRKLADVAYNSKELKNDILKDIFLDGMESDEMSVKLRMNPKAEFKDIYEDALRLETAYRARKIAKGKMEDEPLSILQTQDQTKVYNPNIVCYACKQRGHLAKFCLAKPFNCHRCGIMGHIQKFCPQKISPIQKNYAYDQTRNYKTNSFNENPQKFNKPNFKNYPQNNTGINRYNNQTQNFNHTNSSTYNHSQTSQYPMNKYYDKSMEKSKSYFRNNMNPRNVQNNSRPINLMNHQLRTNPSTVNWNAPLQSKQERGQ